ncbi:MAG: hypothetical protein K0S04_2926 [Herbinix sp.]|nr:hypothetical protein [Herbinix sp.]
MNHANKLIYMAFSAIVFCIGTFLLFYHSKLYLLTLESVTKQGYEDNEVYLQYNADELETITSTELTATLYGSLDYDIRIDGQNIDKEEHDPEDIPGYGIRQTAYKKSYRYDEQGNIQVVIYQSIVE